MGRILIVDDKKNNREMLAKILKDEYEIMEAKNGAEAWEIIIKERKGLSAILLDLKMPEMDGFQVSEKMNQNK